MSGLNFDYLRARTASEAVHQYETAKGQDLTPMYLAGGTEILTHRRYQHINPDVVIDLQPIPAMHEVSLHDGMLCISAGVTLTEITDDGLIQAEFPLLAATAREIADRTARNKITLGGNLCGQIFYRESILPMLVCDTRLSIAGRSHFEVELWRVFRKTIHLEPGQFILSTRTPPSARRARFFHEKRRKAGQVGYPIVTVAAVRVGGKIRAAYSGVCRFPFRSSAMERELNQVGVPAYERIRNAVRVIPVGAVLDDHEASRAYRLAVLQDVLSNALAELGE